MIDKEDFFQLSHLKSCFDGLNRAGAVTRHALEEEQPGLLVEDGVGGPARVTRHVLLDVPPQHVLYVLLLEPACKSVEIRNNKTRVFTEPLMMSWLLPSMAPLVPNSAKRNCNKCLG